MSIRLYDFRFGADEQQIGPGTMSGTAEDDFRIDSGNTLVHDHDRTYIGEPVLRHLAAAGGNNHYELHPPTLSNYIDVTAIYQRDEASDSTHEQLQARDVNNDIVAEVQWITGRRIRLFGVNQQNSALNLHPLTSWFRVGFTVNKSGSAKPGWDPAANGGQGGYTDTAVPSGRCQLRFYPDATTNTPTWVVNDDVRASADLFQVTDGNQAGNGPISPTWTGKAAISDDQIIGPLIRPSVSPQLVTGTPIYEGDTVQVRANSTAPEGVILGNPSWEHQSGPAVVLSDQAVEEPTFVAPAGPATVTLEVAARSTAGIWGEYQSLAIPIAETPTNSPPTITAFTAEPEQLASGQIVLDAIAEDSDGTVESVTIVPPSGVAVTAEAAPPLGVTARWYFDVDQVAIGVYTFGVFATDNEGADSPQVNLSVERIEFGEEVGETLFHRHQSNIPEGAAEWELEIRVRRADESPASAAFIDTVAAISGDDTYQPGGQQDNTTFVIQRADPLRYDDDGNIVEYGPWRVVADGYKIPPADDFSAVVQDHYAPIGAKYRAFSVTEL